NWCFLKSDFGTLAATSDAVAGRVVSADELTPSLEARRLADLAFLDRDQIDEARALIGDLKRRHGDAGSSYAAARSAGGTAYRAGQYDDAAAHFGEALALADEDVNAWLDYATASLRRNPDNYSDRQTAMTDASGGAVNA